MTKNNPNSKKYLEVTSKFENYQMIDSNNLNTDIKGKSMVLLDVKKDIGIFAENKKLRKIGQEQINSETYNIYLTK